MNLNKYIYNKTIRNKKNIFLFLIILICSISIIISLSFYEGYFKEIDNQFTYNIAGRTLVVYPKLSIINNFNEVEMKNYKYDFDNINKINHVIASYSSDINGEYQTDFKDEQYDGLLEIKYGTNKLLENNIIKGKNFSGVDLNEAICPINFYPSHIDEKTKEFKYYDKNILNSNFNIIYDVYQKNEENKNKLIGKKQMEFKIVGLYEADNINDKYNTCYINGNKLNEINKDFMYVLNSDILTSIDVIVDSVDNVNQVAKNLSKLGLSTTPKLEIDNEEIINLKISLIVIILVVIAFLIAFILLYIKKRSNDNKNNINLLYALGFNSSIIKKIFLRNLYIIITSAYILSVIIYILYTKVIQIFELKISTYFNINVFIISIILIYIIPTIIEYIAINSQLKSNQIH